MVNISQWLLWNIFVYLTAPLPNVFMKGVATSRNGLLPLVMPAFTESIRNVTVTLGREAVLACMVENLGDYQIAWIRVDTQTILTIHKHVISRNYRIYLTHVDDKSWFLHIERVQESDRGWYMCQINTDPMISQKGHLEVVVPPEIIDSETSKDIIVEEGQDVTLTCVASGYPLPRIVWKREGHLLISHKGYEVPQVEGQRLILEKVDHSQMGAYFCIANNGVPPTKSKRINLIVYFQPTVAISRLTLPILRGQPYVFLCHVEAFPEPLTYWLNGNDDVISSDEKYHVSSTKQGHAIEIKLQINSVQKGDYGMYKCYSRNSMGVDEGAVFLQDNGTRHEYDIQDVHMMISATEETAQHHNLRHHFVFLIYFLCFY